MLLQIIKFQALLFLFAPPATSQTDSLQKAKLLDPVVVTGNITPTGVSKCVVFTRNINLERLATLGVQNVGDVLKYLPNIRLQQDAVLGAGVSMQGIGGENVKILIDGVAVIGRQNGGIDLSQILLLNVDHIEVIEGPMSVLFGSNALGGTINIITKKNPTKAIDFQLNNYLETVGNANFGAALGLKNGATSLMLSGGRNFFRGWSNTEIRQSETDDSRFQDWKPKVQYFADAHLQTQIGGVKIGYAVNYFDEFILNRGRPIEPYFEKAFDDQYKTRRLSNSLTTTYAVDNQWIMKGQFSYSLYERQKNTFYKNLVNLSEILTANASDQDTTQFSLIAARGSFAKTNGKRWHYEVGFDINDETGEGQRLKNRTQRIGDYAAFLSAEWTITEGVVLRSGLRGSYNTAYNAPLIPSLHLLWLRGDWTFRAAYGKGFRAPSLKELYFYFVDFNHNIRGNENLKAERSDNINVSANFQKPVGKASVYKFEASAFFNNIKDLITLAILRGGNNEYGYININAFRTVGGQIYGEITSGSVSLGVGTAMTRRENTFSNQTFAANTFESRANLNVKNVLKSGFDVNVFYKYSGKQPGFSTDENGDVQPTFIAAYSLADAGVSRKFFKNRIVASFGVRNVFDVRNVTAQLAAGGGAAHSSSSNSTALATGRQAFLKLDIVL